MVVHQSMDYGWSARRASAFWPRGRPIAPAAVRLQWVASRPIEDTVMAGKRLKISNQSPRTLQRLKRL